jgi:hypothetical protein
LSIVSGVYGLPSGGTIVDLGLFKADVARFGNIPGVRVHNFNDMTPKQLTDLLTGSGTTIDAFCDSAACLAFFR